MNQTDACLKCTLCVSACPVYRNDGDFPGPKALGPEWERRRAAGERVVMDHVDDCTFCQLCELACPVGVPIAHLIAEQKDRARSTRSAAVRLRDTILTHPEWVARAPRLSATPAPLSRLMRLSTISRRPRPRSATGGLPRTVLESRGSVGLLVDCFDRGFDQETIAAARALLTAWGFDVSLAPKRSLCCGAAAYASGRVDQAKQQAGAMHDALSRDLPLGAVALVTLNATCDGTIDHEWHAYLGLEPLPIPVIPFDQFALDHAPKSFWEAIRAPEDPGGLSATVWTHTTCRGRRRGDGALMELAQHAGVGNIQPLLLECCGAAGSYAFKAEHDTTAHAMANEATAQIGGRSGELWVDSGTCAIHLEQVAGVSARHPAHWLYRRWRHARMDLGKKIP